MPLLDDVAKRNLGRRSKQPPGDLEREICNWVKDSTHVRVELGVGIDLNAPAAREPDRRSEHPGAHPAVGDLKADERPAGVRQPQLQPAYERFHANGLAALHNVGQLVTYISMTDSFDD
jgi:hypothetical protein